MKNSTTNFLYERGFREILMIGENQYNLPPNKMVFVNRDGMVLVPMNKRAFPNLYDPDSEDKEDD